MTISAIRSRYRRRLQRYLREIEEANTPDLGKARVVIALYQALLGYFNAEEAGEIAARMEELEKRIAAIESKKGTP